jgi:hypothetical protein
MIAGVRCNAVRNCRAPLMVVSIPLASDAASSNSDREQDASGQKATSGEQDYAQPQTHEGSLTRPETDCFANFPNENALGDTDIGARQESFAISQLAGPVSHVCFPQYVAWTPGLFNALNCSST